MTGWCTGTDNAARRWLRVVECAVDSALAISLLFIRVWCRTAIHRRRTWRDWCWWWRDGSSAGKVNLQPFIEGGTGAGQIKR